MRVKVLTAFDYYHDGYTRQHAEVGEQELPDHIAAMVVRDKLAEPVKAEKAEKAKADQKAEK